MKLSEWVKNNWTHITIEKIINNGKTILTIPELNIDLTIGIISTSDKTEFSKLVFHLAPVGIIVDEISDEYYEGQLLLTRNYLTKLLIREPNSKVAEKYLNILERRDRTHWGKESGKMTATVSDKDGKTVNLTYQVI